MAIAFIQQVAEQSTASVASFTSSAINVTTGNDMVACMSVNQNTTLTASDSEFGSTWFPAITKSTSVESVAIATADVVTTVPTTYTVTPGVSGFCAISAQEYSGFLAGNPIDTGTNSAGPTTSTAVDPGAINPPGAGDLYVSCWTHSGTGSPSFTANTGAGWNLRSNLTNTANMPLGSEDLVASGSQSGTATLGASVSWIAAVASFKAAGGGSSALPFRRSYRPFPFKPGSPR